MVTKKEEKGGVMH